MTSIGEAERRRLDPLSLPDPRAFSRWRELQKMGAQKFEEGTYREEKIKMQEALGHPDLTDEQRVEAMTEAIDEAEAAVGYRASGVHEHWTARTVEQRDLLQEQLASRKALQGGIKAMVGPAYTPPPQPKQPSLYQWHVCAQAWKLFR